MIIRDGDHVFHTEERGRSDSHVLHAEKQDCGGGLLLLSYEGPGGEVKLPEGVTCVCEDAFAYCKQVTDVIMPGTVRRIARRAFFRSGIRTVSLPDSLNSIEEFAFSGTPLERVDIPGGIDIIPKEAFRGCSSLRKVWLGDGVKMLKKAAFKDCTALEKVRIPAGLCMINGNAFENDDRIVLTGPGRMTGLIVNMDPVVYYDPETGKMTVPEGVRELPESWRLWAQTGIKVLDLPRSLKYYNWYYLSLLGAAGNAGTLRRIVTDRDALAAEIALMLDVECVDRDGQSFTFQVPSNIGSWIFEPDEEYNGVCLTERRGRIGATGMAFYTTVVIPNEINGKPVTSIGAGAFEGCSDADAFYIPDSVKRIGRRAFGNSVFCKKHFGQLFLRLPEHVSIAEDAFKGTKYITIESVRRELQQRETQKAYEAEMEARWTDSMKEFAEKAADDPAIGTGTESRPALMPNIWKYFDRLSREERVRELTHFFVAWAPSAGAGEAYIWIALDQDRARFHINSDGKSPADFRRFAGQIEDGGNQSFIWTSERGDYSWNIQRRSGIVYVSVPKIGKGFFFSYEAFLRAIEGLSPERPTETVI